MGPRVLPSVEDTHPNFAEMMEYARLWHMVKQLEAGIMFKSTVYVEQGIDAWERYRESRGKPVGLRRN